MINLLIVSATGLCAYFDFFFWTVLFTAVAILRIRCNRNVPLFVITIIGTILTTVLVKYITHIIVIPKLYGVIFTFQFLMVIWSLVYNWKLKLWRRDVVFFTMEPSLMLILGSYFVFSGLTLSTYYNLLTWLYTYIGIQAFLVVLKLSIGYRLASKARSLLERLKLLIAYLPHIKPSFGLQDFSVSTGVSYFYQPTHLDNVMNELKFAENMIFAEMSGKVAEKEKLKKEREKLLGDNSGFARFLKTLSN